ncbi:MAG: carbon-nitrogen hydrolase family protein [Candidatus Omnitrophica bacterium]|nr:carbon-nitrogen hydrolase family protein [Candidatus Omnitrophota bacterium]
MKVAIIQIDSRADKASNIKKALVLSEEAFSQGADFVLLPEFFSFRGPIKNLAYMGGIAEPVNGPTVRAFSVLAQRFRKHLLLGTIYERATTGRKAYNTSILISPDGKVAASYRKQNLFHMRLLGQETREGKVFKAGHKLTVVPVGEFHVGIVVCFDLRFPDIFERCAKRGANLFVVPSSFAYVTGQAHWEVLLRARAIETFSYVVAPNQIGKNAEGVRCWGHSMVIDPWGKILVQASADQEEIVYADIEIAKVRKYRRLFPGYKK